MYDPNRHHRRSIRLPDFDYSRSGAYFVTLCVHRRLAIFGDVADGRMQCSPAGHMIQSAWNDLAKAYLDVRLDAFIVMPNHVHGVLWLDNPKSHLREELKLRFPNQRPKGTDDGTLGRVMQRFKSLTTNRYIQGVKASNWPAFDRHVWQPNYFEHIIRTDESLAAIREYVLTNPQRWPADKENPNGTGEDDVETWVTELCRGEPCVRPDSGPNEVSASRRGEPRVRLRPPSNAAASAVDPDPPLDAGEHKVRPYKPTIAAQKTGEHEVRPYEGRIQDSPLRIGHGYDLHRLQPGGKLMLGGVEVSADLSPVAHSDGDVVIHALVDALLGAMAWGDIGELFPNTDPQWKDAPSRVFLEHVYSKIRAEGYWLVNADITVLAERPKLKAFKPQMRQFLQSILGGTINVKAGTNEGCDAIGRGEAIAAHAVVLLARAG